MQWVLVDPSLPLAPDACLLSSPAWPAGGAAAQPLLTPAPSPTLTLTLACRHLGSNKYALARTCEVALTLGTPMRVQRPFSSPLSGIAPPPPQGAQLMCKHRPGLWPLYLEMRAEEGGAWRGQHLVLHDGTTARRSARIHADMLAELLRRYEGRRAQVTPPAARDHHTPRLSPPHPPPNLSGSL